MGKIVCDWVRGPNEGQEELLMSGLMPLNKDIFEKVPLKQKNITTSPSKCGLTITINYCPERTPHNVRDSNESRTPHNSIKSKRTFLTPKLLTFGEVHKTFQIGAIFGESPEFTDAQTGTSKYLEVLCQSLPGFGITQHIEEF